MKNQRKCLVFGANGELGKSTLERIQEDGWIAFPILKSDSHRIPQEKFNAAIWCQGANLTKSFEDSTDQDIDAIFEANLFFFLRTLRDLLKKDSFEDEARLVVISSVFEEVSRPNKSLYSTSKAALGGLVRSLSTELGPMGIQINSVLPGVVDTSMTRNNLSQSELTRVQEETPNRRLISKREVANLVSYLISSDSSGITGQSIVIDGGWSNARLN